MIFNVENALIDSYNVQRDILLDAQPGENPAEGSGQPAPRPRRVALRKRGHGKNTHCQADHAG